MKLQLKRTECGQRATLGSLWVNGKPCETYIYTLSDPMTNKVRYVGKTDNINARYRLHIRKNEGAQSHAAGFLWSQA